MATPLHFCKNSVSPVRLWGIGLCGRGAGVDGAVWVCRPGAGVRGSGMGVFTEGGCRADGFVVGVGRSCGHGAFPPGRDGGCGGVDGDGRLRMSRRWEKPAVSVRGDRKILTDLAQDNGNCQQVNSSS